ncbi:uncharacterized protein LOC112171024 [Rosa chinensis]|uniref:uncharacterized protein LOC112171024 n=1 Tax=Rosa chinensis TaxID=74649 RepID=UPI000D090A19|nr:uncharacterized protein LOC112171024 [Rosa chinensis]
MKRLWAKYRQSRDEDLEELCTTNALVVAAVTEAEASSGSRRRGSQPGRAQNEERFRESRGKNMMEDYFVERPVFTEEKSDAAGKVGLLPQQKLTCSLRMLAYDAGADQCAEYCRMAKSTSIEALKRFTRGIINLYSAEYLRAPNPTDLRRLLAKAERRGFPGMIGSIDCMHWQWKNCPIGWAGEYSCRKREPTIILEAVTSYDTWIWHALFGMPGSCNDLNVLAKSPLFDELTAGRAPKIQFQVNNRIHNLGYYLADGIYPQWATFVKSIPRPTLPKDLKFSQAQEGYR